MSNFCPLRLDHSVSKLVNPLVTEYLSGSNWANNLVHFPFSLEGMDAAMEHRANFPHRQLLVERLLAQNATLDLTDATKENIEALRENKTFCVTTGHQLCLLTGPLYFIHKIVSTIKLAEMMKERHPNNHFVPIYWMASEDHDLPEVDHFNFGGERYQWQTDQTGAVGRMDLNGIDKFLGGFLAELGSGDLVAKAKEEILAAYKPTHNLALATRLLVNALLGQYGVVVLDGDDVELKKAFTQVMLQEVRDRKSKELIEATVDSPEWKFKVQVNPRAINLFYLDGDSRERVVYNSEEELQIGQRKLSLKELQEELKDHPERFSPNVVLRPVYEEVILPNLAYVGGAGELAYWLELKTTFEQFGMKMPVLALRDHVLWLKRKPLKKMEKLGLQLEDLFRNLDDLIAEKVSEDRAADLDITKEAVELDSLFERMHAKASALDATLGPSAEAERASATKSMKRLQKKMLRAAKRQNADQVRMLRGVMEVVRPNGSFQERHDNLLDIYLEFGPALFEALLQNSDPFKRNLLVLQEEAQ